MAFTRVNVPPATDSRVTIRFSGLMLLKSDDGRTCEVGINRFSCIHSFQVMLVVTKPDRPPTLIRLLNGPLLRELSIDVVGVPSAGFKAFCLPGDFDRTAEANNLLDHRWAINLRIQHPGADFNDGARPVARLSTGVLYSSSLTDPGAGPVLEHGGSRTPLIRIAGDLAASIPLAGGLVRLRWDECGEPKEFLLPRRLDPATAKYTVVLLNEPASVNPPPHEELPLYYRVLHVGGASIPEPRCRLVFDGDPTTDEIPCNPIVLNQ
ncbi:MAG TPA: hypothetical protein VJR02_15060 [Pyrinomonadaceae bacterium]|nr:hypothetical protein [Pyrinomonadaceae bacterium]